MSDADRLRWEAHYRDKGPSTREPSSFLVSLDEVLPRRGRALDVAGGAGRNAVWLARRGLAVTALDISETALAIARTDAARAGVVLSTLAIDLEVEPLPPGPWDLVLSFHYLQRGLFARFPEVLAPGGLLVYVQATRSNLERWERPSERFLLEDGELARLVTGLEVLRLEEGWLDEGHHDARLLARKPL
ncbi:MAG: methyltransferase domain-containing protein [Deltaproteobacteria bacterium]|nr:methyltransferase domain-containing protein [Deltaproteobacteria bacterium]